MFSLKELNSGSLGIYKVFARPLSLKENSIIHYEKTGRENHMLLLIHEGDIVYAQNNQEYLKAHTRDVLFLPSGSCYTSRPLPPYGIKGDFIQFQLFADQGHVPALGDRPERILSDASNHLGQQFKQLTDSCMHSSGALKSLSILTDLLSELLETRQLENQALHTIAPAQQYMRKHLKGPVSLDFLAELCHMSKRTFCRYFHEALGEAPMTYHRRLRILKAKELLESGLYNVEQTAEVLGFVDAAHLSHAFLKKMGYTAGSIRTPSCIVYTQSATGIVDSRRPCPPLHHCQRIKNR